MTDPITRRAEEIRETTGMAWELACRLAERERDAARRPIATHYAREAAEAHADRIGGTAFPMGNGRWDVYGPMRLDFAG